jgi:hypothetical protein
LLSQSLTKSRFKVAVAVMKVCIDLDTALVRLFSNFIIIYLLGFGSGCLANRYNKNRPILTLIGYKVEVCREVSLNVRIYCRNATQPRVP